jgi:hypothetical protein
MPIVLPDYCQKITCQPRRLALGIVLAGCLMLGLSLPALAERNEEPQLDGVEAQNNAQNAKPSAFEGGVKAYREGDYRQARKIFDALHARIPENTKITYYLAITEAQLGRFQQAQKFYGEIITLDPHGETAALAQEGLKYLPPETSLDFPPRFNQPVTAEKPVPGQSVTASQPGNPPVAASAAPIVSPQDLMAWQMMMGQNNNGMGGGNNNPMGSFMPNMMMGGNGANSSNGANSGGMSAFDPNMMSTMMMNQMMQNMNPGGDQNENR